MVYSKAVLHVGCTPAGVPTQLHKFHWRNGVRELGEVSLIWEGFRFQDYRIVSLWEGERCYKD
jgi:hypothetical protein